MIYDEKSDQLTKKWRATFLRRWHANPDLCDTHDTLAGHQGRVAIIIHHLWPDCRKELLVAALHHDMGEPFFAGDVSYRAKADNPDLAEMLSEGEKRAIEALGVIYDLTPDEERKLKFADRLDAAMWVEHHKPELTYDGEWAEEIDRLCQEEIDLGILEGVQ